MYIFCITDAIGDFQNLEAEESGSQSVIWETLTHNMQELRHMLSLETKFRVKTRLLAKVSTVRKVSIFGTNQFMQEAGKIPENTEAPPRKKMSIIHHDTEPQIHQGRTTTND